MPGLVLEAVHPFALVAPEKVERGIMRLGVGYAVVAGRQRDVEALVDAKRLAGDCYATGA